MVRDWTAAAVHCNSIPDATPRSNDDQRPTGLKTVGHIYVAEKPDFYEITDDLPQFQQSSNGVLVNDYK